MARTLVTPSVDLWLFGGLSLLVAVVSWWASPPTFSANFFWALNLCFSAPHFFASYRVLYGRGGPWRAHPVVSWWLPVALLAFLAVALGAQTPNLMVAAAQGTLLLLHWHYLKQTYGVALWAGRPETGRISEGERQLTLGVCLALGVGGYLSAQSEPQSMRAFGLYLKPFPLPDETLGVVRNLGVVALAVFVAGLVYFARRRGRSSLSWRALIPVAALWTWMDPRFDGSLVKLILPVFHGLQYLPFPARVFATESGESRGRFFVWCVGWIVLGYLWFQGLPGWLSVKLPAVRAERAFPFFIVFVNLHHYFIDAVIWRFREPGTLGRLGFVPAGVPSQSDGAKRTGTW